MQYNTIIYDDCCPLCTAYTSTFVNNGLISKSGRKSFSDILPQLLLLIDIEKAVNEIPLVNEDRKQVWYGIDALLEILGHRFACIKKTGNLPPIKWVLTKLYKLISYNRRVIVARSDNANNTNCTLHLSSIIKHSVSSIQYPASSIQLLL